MTLIALTSLIFALTVSPAPQSGYTNHAGNVIAGFSACEKIVGDIDRKPKQVYVEARFFDLMASDLAGVGIDWSMLASGSIPGANPLTASGNGTITADGGRRIMI